MRAKKWLTCVITNTIIFALGLILINYIGFNISLYYVGIIVGLLIGLIDFMIIWN